MITNGEITMNSLAKLTTREAQIAELFAWGASKKYIAGRLFVSERTVENHARNIYEKIGCNKVNELSAWWFCTKFNISFDLSPLKQRIVAFVMLILIVPTFINDSSALYALRTRTATTRTCRISRRKSDSDSDIDITM